MNNIARIVQKVRHENPINNYSSKKNDYRKNDGNCLSSPAIKVLTNIRKFGQHRVHREIS